jgi:hypothetical protein
MITIINSKFKGCYRRAIGVILCLAAFPAYSQLTVTIYGSSSVCSNATSIGFAATTTGVVGTITLYNWYENNVPISGAHSSTVGVTSFSSSDVFTCQVLTSSGQNQYSNPITITTTQPQNFGISLTANQTAFCAGQTVTYTATPNMSATGGYTWEVNGVVQSATGNTFSMTVATVAALQSVTVTGTTNAACVVNPTATGTSANIPFTIYPVTSPSVSIAQSVMPVLEGSPVTFTVTPSGQGSDPVYQWQLNGMTVQNGAGNTYTPTITSGSDVQSVTVSMTSNETCPQNSAISTLSFQLVSSDWENLNYVREQDRLVMGVSNFISIDQLPIGQKFEKTIYFDGLGRAIQKLNKSGSLVTGGSQEDLVTPLVYDPAGRVTQQYLPYATTDNPGHFKSTNVFTEQASFVTGKFGEPSGAPTYAQTVYDNSPLNRVVQSFAPGQSWGGQRRGNKQQLRFRQRFRKCSYLADRLYGRRHSYYFADRGIPHRGAL